MAKKSAKIFYTKKLTIVHHLILTILKMTFNFSFTFTRPAFGINGRFAASEKKIDINFSKAKTKFCLSLHYNNDNSYLFVNGKEIYKFKANNGNVNFPSRFCLGSISNEFDYVD